MQARDSLCLARRHSLGASARAILGLRCVAGWGRAAEELVSGLVAIGCGCGLATGCVDELRGGSTRAWRSVMWRQVEPSHTVDQWCSVDEVSTPRIACMCAAAWWRGAGGGEGRGHTSWVGSSECCVAFASGVTLEHSSCMTCNIT